MRDVVKNHAFEKAKQAKMQAASKDFVYIASSRRFLRRNGRHNLRLLDDNGFKAIASRDYSFRYENGDGAVRTWFPTGELLRSMHPELVVDDVVFRPGAEPIFRDRDGSVVYNLWAPPPWKPLKSWKGEPELFLSLIRLLFDDDEEAVRHVLSWIAHMVQRPEQRINHAILPTSRAQGLGKSMLGTILRRLVGESSSGTVQAKELRDRFDDWVSRKVLVVADEIYEAGNRDLLNRLKPLITEPCISVNIKYGPMLRLDN